MGVEEEAGRRVYALKAFARRGGQAEQVLNNRTS